MGRNNKSRDMYAQNSTDEDEAAYSSDEDLLIPNGNNSLPAIETCDPDANDLSASINAPTDRYNVIYIIFLIQGVGMLLPWNFFITARDYFVYKFSNDKSVQNKFENAFALAAMFPNVISLFINIFLTNKLSRGCRVITCLMIMFISFAVTALLTRIDTQSHPDTFFAVTIAIVVVVNLATGVYQGTLFGVAGIVGQRYIQGIMSGQAIAGIFAAIADLISKLVSRTPDHLTSALIYFIIATVVIAVTALSYTMLFKMPRMQFYFRRFERHSEKDMRQRQVQMKKEEEKATIPYWLIFKQISPMALSVMSVFCVTLSMFPAVISKIESVDSGNGSRWTTDLFATLVCFLIFNTGDWVGRILAGQFQIINENRSFLMPLLCISRIVFIPLFLMCNVKNAPHLPYVFKHDFWPVIINLLFSITNGYFGSLCMMFGPKLVAIEYAETAGTIMSLFLTVGLSLGACISFVF